MGCIWLTSAFCATCDAILELQTNGLPDFWPRCFRDLSPLVDENNSQRYPPCLAPGVALEWILFTDRNDQSSLMEKSS